jgi:hypothetical protein
VALRSRARSAPEGNPMRRVLRWWRRHLVVRRLRPRHAVALPADATVPATADIFVRVPPDGGGVDERSRRRRFSTGGDARRAVWRGLLDEAVARPFATPAPFIVSLETSAVPADSGDGRAAWASRNARASSEADGIMISATTPSGSGNSSRRAPDRRVSIPGSAAARFPSRVLRQRSTWLSQRFSPAMMIVRLPQTNSDERSPSTLC